MARFGQRELKQAGIDNTYIPLGADTSIYRPLDKAACKKLMFFDPDEFVVGIVARNQSRKLIHRQLRGYKAFLDKNPGIKCHLMLWSSINPPQLRDSTLGLSDVGIQLMQEIMDLGLGEAVRWPDPKLIEKGLPEWTGELYNEAGWDMVKLMNSFDVLLACSGGEGFSLPLIESQACGTPVITTDYAAGPEQVGAGLTVGYDDYIIMSSVGTRYALPSIDGMAEALTKIYNADRTKLAKRARAYALRYDWNRIMTDYWEPFLKSCEDEIRPLITKEGSQSWS